MCEKHQNGRRLRSLSQPLFQPPARFIELVRWDRFRKAEGPKSREFVNPLHYKPAVWERLKRTTSNPVHGVFVKEFTDNTSGEGAVRLTAQQSEHPIQMSVITNPIAFEQSPVDTKPLVRIVEVPFVAALKLSECRKEILRYDDHFLFRACCRIDSRMESRMPFKLF